MRYRLIPKTIEAIRFDGVVFSTDHPDMYNILFDTRDDLPKWLRNGLIDEKIFVVKEDPDYIFVVGEENLLEAKAGDWIVCDEKGCLSVIKADLFARTYEAVPDEIHGAGV